MTDDGKIPAAADDADSAMAVLRADYERWTHEALRRMNEALITARGQTGARALALRQLFDAAHDVKGQGASFGYPLLSRIGQSLCRLGHAASSESFPTEALKAAGAHVDAMKIILEKRIRGDGGDLGARLAAKLEAMAA